MHLFDDGETVIENVQRIDEFVCECVCIYWLGRRIFVIQFKYLAQNIQRGIKVNESGAFYLLLM